MSRGCLVQADSHGPNPLARITTLCEQQFRRAACGTRPRGPCLSSPALTDTSTAHAAAAAAQRDQRRRHAVSPGASRCARGARRPRSSHNPPTVRTGARCCRRHRQETRREHSRSGSPQRSVASSAPNPPGRGKTPARRQSAALAEKVIYVSRAACVGTDSRSSARYSACLTDPFLPGPTSLTRSLCGA